MLPNILGGNSTRWRTIPRKGVLSSQFITLTFTLQRFLYAVSHDTRNLQQIDRVILISGWMGAISIYIWHLVNEGRYMIWTQNLKAWVCFEREVQRQMGQNWGSGIGWSVGSSGGGILSWSWSWLLNMVLDMVLVMIFVMVMVLGKPTRTIFLVFL